MPVELCFNNKSPTFILTSTNFRITPILLSLSKFTSSATMAMAGMTSYYLTRAILIGDTAALFNRLRSNRAQGFLVVQEFLKAHPECLEDFVYNHVTVEDLERLLIRKTHRQTHFSGLSQTSDF